MNDPHHHPTDSSYHSDPDASGTVRRLYRRIPQSRAATTVTVVVLLAVVYFVVHFALFKIHHH